MHLPHSFVVRGPGPLDLDCGPVDEQRIDAGFTFRCHPRSSFARVGCLFCGLAHTGWVAGRHDPGIWAREDQGDVSVAQPLDDVRRSAVLVLDTDDQANTVAVAINDQAVADTCLHDGLLTLFAPPEPGLTCWPPGPVTSICCHARLRAPQSASGRGPSLAGRWTHSPGPQAGCRDDWPGIQARAYCSRAVLNPARPPPPLRPLSRAAQLGSQRHGRGAEASAASVVYALPLLLPDRHTYGTGVERWHGRELTSDDHRRTAVRENDRARGLRGRRIAVHDPGRPHIRRQPCRLSRGPRCHVSSVRLRRRRMRSWYDIARLLRRCRPDDRFRPARSGYGN